MQPRLELMSLGKIRAAKHNPKQHDIPGIMASIRRFGFVDFPTMNEKTGRLVEGHGRQIALKGIKRDGPRPKLDTSWPPANVVEKGKSWLVPVIRGLSWESDQEAAAYLAAHNQLTRAAGWDDGGLADLLADVQANSERGLEGLGFDDDYVTGLLAAAEAESGEIYAPAKDPDIAGIDNVPDLPTKAVTKPGDVWTLGKHRLVCGDCRATDTIALQGASIASVVTDPPYGMQFQSNYRETKHRVIAGDHTDELLHYACALAAVHSKYVWCRWDNMRTAQPPTSVITWVKNNWSMGDLKHAHARQTEICLFYPGHTHGWPDGRPSDVIICDRTGNTLHPTEKPVDAIRKIIGWTHGIVFDPFLGSGTTIIAAEVLDRQCCGVELDPAYCDVIIERWETLTGGKATRQSGPPKKTRKGRTRVTRTTKATA